MGVGGEDPCSALLNDQALSGPQVPWRSFGPGHYSEPEAQRVQATCPRSHSLSVVHLGLELLPLGSKSSVFSQHFKTLLLRKERLPFHVKKN